LGEKGKIMDEVEKTLIDEIEEKGIEYDELETAFALIAEDCDEKP
jgi:hypothetical protein